MNVLEVMDVIICAIILMVHSIAIVIQATCYIPIELLAQVDFNNCSLELKLYACMSLINM